MQAIEFHGAERLELVERPDPAPAAGQLLIAPSAVGICGTDVEIFEGSLAYFRMGIAEYPIVPGHEWTGVVVDLGEGVTGFSPGDQVVGEVAIGCGVCVRCQAGRSHLCARRTETGIVHMDGAMATRMVFPAAYAHVVPFESRAAALVEPTSVALHGVTRGNVAGRSVVVIGVGPIGLLTAQIARARGAAQVLVADTRSDRLQLAASLGFAAYEPVGEDGPDVALLCAGGPGAIRAALHFVRPGGTVVALGLSGKPEIPFDWDGLVVRDIDLIGVLGSVGYWEGAIELIASGAVVTEPLVTQTFGLEHARDAIERLVDPGSLKVLVEPR